MREGATYHTSLCSGLVTGIVLAGGQSRRFGRDKSLAQLESRTLLEHVVAAIEDLVAEVIIVGHSSVPPGQVPRRLIRDEIVGRGPLGGLSTGLRAMQTEWALALACDMPMIEPALMRFMLRKTAGVDAVVPYTDRPQPLLALYHRRCIEPIERSLNSGRLEMTSWLNGVHVAWIDRDTMAPYDRDGHSFFNVNTPADLAVARQVLGSHL